MSRRPRRIAVPNPGPSVTTRSRTSARASDRVGGTLNATTRSEEEKTTEASSTRGHRGAAVPRSDNDEHLKDRRLTTLDRASQSQVEGAVVDVSPSAHSPPDASSFTRRRQIPPTRQANLSPEDAPPSRDTNTETAISDDDREMDHIPSSSIQGQSSRPPTTPGPPDSTTRRIWTDLYEETYHTRGQNAFYQSKMHESKEDFAIRLKEMKEASIREGLAMNAKIREQRLKDSPKTHMTKPGYGGVPIELRTHQSRWEYYGELLDEAIGDARFDGVQREWSEQELKAIAAANKTFQEAADLPFKSPR
ncbi:hypothetical protein BDP27DRAFT_1337625 [Rhodocollybia butyracea]|uniref:Uncharacterized protein n=1 Tax=Rhodocollybia butyracea TaxID=206335 RepID=A0A9P5U0W3_9AGAR|nr:hypothetical protein BDP27DRAFT_1340195 [Rhodocollybia butyracea]KAF9061744.1 hypothetical protein BDP27DRAFT_1337625 [Rhodocollybia butyracea]